MPKAPKTARRELTVAQRREVYIILSTQFKDGKLPRGLIQMTAAEYDVGRKAVSNLWKEARDRFNTHLSTIQDAPDHVIDDANKLRNIPLSVFTTKGNRGRPKKWDRDEVMEMIKAVPQYRRKTYRRLHAATDIPLATLHRFVKQEKILYSYVSSVKPTLSDERKLDRIGYAMEQIDPRSLETTRHGTGIPKFLDMYDRVHVDEKWFYITKEKQKYILVRDEEPPKRETRHTGHIEKVMFLVAQARPRYVSAGVYWDGKIGCWPIGEMGTAVRTSVHRPAGAPVWNNLSMDKPLYLHYMKQVAEAIHEKWPRGDYNRRGFKVLVQQDNAPAHFDADDDDWIEFLEEKGLDDKIELYCQVPNSPDNNILDLGFFNALQADYYLFVPKTSLDIIDMVKESYANYDPKKINRIWLTYQSCLNCILESAGGNHYRIPHMNKDKLEREKRLPKTLEVSAAVALYW